jgi:hypothetical protein
LGTGLLRTCRARRIVTQRFSAAEMAEQTQTLYEHLLAARGIPRGHAGPASRRAS